MRSYQMYLGHKHMNSIGESKRRGEKERKREEPGANFTCMISTVPGKAY